MENLLSITHTLRATQYTTKFQISDTDLELRIDINIFQNLLGHILQSLTSASFIDGMRNRVSIISKYRKCLYALSWT